MRFKILTTVVLTSLISVAGMAATSPITASAAVNQFIELGNPAHESESGIYPAWGTDKCARYGSRPSINAQATGPYFANHRGRHLKGEGTFDVYAGGTRRTTIVLGGDYDTTYEGTRAFVSFFANAAHCDALQKLLEAGVGATSTKYTFVLAKASFSSPDGVVHPVVTNRVKEVVKADAVGRLKFTSRTTSSTTYTWKGRLDVVKLTSNGYRWVGTGAGRKVRYNGRHCTTHPEVSTNSASEFSYTLSRADGDRTDAFFDVAGIGMGGDGLVINGVVVNRNHYSGC